MATTPTEAAATGPEDQRYIIRFQKHSQNKEAPEHKQVPTGS